MDLHLSICDDFVSSNIYGKREDFNFDVVNFPFLDVDAQSPPPYGVYRISQLIRLLGVCSNVEDFLTCNKF